MSISMILGRDLLKQVTLCKNQANKSETVSDEGVAKLLSINAVKITNNASDSLVIDPKVPQEKQTELKKIFEKEYVKAERPVKPKVNAKLKLQLKDVQPFHFASRQLAFMEREELQRILNDLLVKGVIRPSTSEYASPIVLVREKNGEYRLCIDYRTLNKYIARTNYPIPVIEDQINILKRKKIFQYFRFKRWVFSYQNGLNRLNIQLSLHRWGNLSIQKCHLD